jgi:2-dehydropantoate 2-reductase
MSAPVTGSSVSAVSSLSIAVVGMGGVGSTFAYHLARAGHDVTAVARPGSVRLAQLKRDGGIVHETGGRAEVRVADGLDPQVAYDLVVVTTLDHQVDAVLPSLRHSRAKAVHFMFNTFDPERLRDALGRIPSSFGMPFVMATVGRDGKLHAKMNPGQKTLHGDLRWVALFHDAGIPSAFEADMLLWLRCHVPLCVAFESISVLGQRRGGGASWAEALVVARGMRAGFEVIAALGHRLHPSAQSWLARCPTFLVALMLWSVSRIRSFRELLATGTNECRALLEKMVSAAAAVKPAPTAAVKALVAMTPAEAIPPSVVR